MGNCQCAYCFASNSNPITTLNTQHGFSQQTQLLIDNIRQKNKNKLKNMKEHRFQQKLFRGTLLGGKKTGYGEFYGNNNAYFGQFQNDLPHGEGLLIKNYKDYIKGEFQQGKPNGQVKQKINNSQFQGHYTNGEKMKGILKTDDFIYEGSFKNNKFHDYGIISYKNGDRYEGSFNSGLYHGDGKYETVQQGVYKGQFKNGFYDGKGLFKWRNGYYYEGQYRNGVRNGFGKFKKGKDEHQGQWVEGQLHNNQKFLAPKENNLLQTQ